MKEGKIHIGTSGWSYKDWKGIYYPKNLKSTEWLTFYSETFNITEINTSFYHLPKKQTVEGWVNKVPDDFLFCPKISRYLTHMKKLHEPEESLERFFDVFEPMQKKMGPVLIQLPPSLKFNPEVADHFFNLLKSTYHPYTFALEVRHNTWMTKESIDLMSLYHIAFVISQSGHGFPYAEHITAKDIYIRFHGPGKLYASLYSEEEMQKYANLFRSWQKEGHTLWIFFNNDFYGYAIKNGLQLETWLNPARAKAKESTHRQVLALL
ncbi:MAG TPA: DUF72 domain-containing protein [Ohtaekwangia sp.]